MNQDRKKAILLPISATIALFGCAMILPISGMILSQMHPKEPSKASDYLIVLGARVKGDQPGIALQSRAQAACEYLQTHPETFAVLSGGIHPGERISEAECMRRFLIAGGIDETRLIMEEHSANTEENLIFSVSLIPKGKQVGVLTSDYHLFRAKMLARKMGIAMSGYAATSKRDQVFLQSFLREHAAVIKSLFNGKI